MTNDMNDKPQIKLSETVVLIDAAFLNFVITDMKKYFEATLQRTLQEIDLWMPGLRKEKMKCSFFLFMIKSRVILCIASLLTWRRS